MKIFEPHEDNYLVKGEDPIMDEDWDKFIEMTQDEVDIVQKELAACNSIVQYYEFTQGKWLKKNGEDKFCAYLVMDFVDGIDLKEY